MIYKHHNTTGHRFNVPRDEDMFHSIEFAFERSRRLPNAWGLADLPLEVYGMSGGVYAYLGDMIVPPTSDRPAQYEILGGAFTYDIEVTYDGIIRTLRNVVGLFKVNGAQRGVGHAIMTAIISQAKRDHVILVLDAYDEHKLSAFYSRLGFVAWGHVDFDEEHAPERWYDGCGRPPVKAWYHLASYDAPYMGRFDDYEAMLAERNKFLTTNNWRQ